MYGSSARRYEGQMGNNRGKRPGCSTSQVCTLHTADVGWGGGVVSFSCHPISGEKENVRASSDSYFALVPVEARMYFALWTSRDRIPWRLTMWEDIPVRLGQSCVCVVPARWYLDPVRTGRRTRRGSNNLSPGSRRTHTCGSVFLVLG